ncbi:MerR family transcriptional regulator [Streptomyces sp. NPDC047515]|uniref:MerR family transcriptional regulator n=1 Tax=Streptomyces sp. NPDC047515 TaxID=3155380 RepID=UPI0033EA05B5
MDRELSLPEVAAAHAEALTAQIRTLRTLRAVLTAVARRGSTPKEMDLMHSLAQLTEDQRRNLMGEFLDTAFGGLDAAGEFTGIMRSMTPELPDDADTEQVEAWIELAELSQDPEFRAVVRRLAGHHAAMCAQGGPTGPRRDPAATVRDHVAPALEAGLAPTSPRADPVVEAVMTRYAHDVAHLDDTDLRHRLLTVLETANDPRRLRYAQLLAVINAWPPPPDDPTPAFTWFTEALRARLPA